MPKAKSRLARSRLKRGKKNKKSKRSKGAERQWRSWLQAYWQHLPTLLVGLIFAAVTGLILTQVQPLKIKHFLLPHSYLPLLLAVFATCWFVASFVLLNTRRGLILALWCSLLLFLRLQQVLLTWQTMLIPAVVLFLMEVVLSAVTSVQDS
jgi:hypothetical protein